jgi:hypothetical protein
MQVKDGDGMLASFIYKLKLKTIRLPEGPLRIILFELTSKNNVELL